MSVNARTEEYEHVELFGKPALFTNSRIDRSSVPSGFFCYDLRGSDRDPGRPVTLENKVVVNHSGTVLTPEEITIPKEGFRRLRGKLDFLGECLSLSEFCSEHNIRLIPDNRKFTLRPAFSEEARFFYALPTEQDAELGAIGHVRIDFGHGGKEFWHTWWPRGDESLNSPEFKADLANLVNELRESGPLKDLASMSEYCRQHGGQLEGGQQQNYGYVIETDKYRYCLRCNPVHGDYQAYLTAFDLSVLKLTDAYDDLTKGTAITSRAETLREDIPEQTMTIGGMQMNQHPKWVEFMREQYPPGTRIRLTEMNDPYSPVAPGTEGTLNYVDDACQLQMTWDNGRTLAIIPGVDRFSVIPQPLQTLKLYMPLTVTTYERNEWGDLENDPIELDTGTVAGYSDNILAAIIKERMPEEAERGLMKYYGEDDSVNRKVQSYVFTVEKLHGKLMGAAECRIKDELTAEELIRLKDDISGQASDGFGEGFEQRPIKTADGEFFVSLWSSDKSWSIMTLDELEQVQQMGGMQLG